MESKQRVSVIRSRTNLLDGSYLDYISQGSSSGVDDSPPLATSSTTSSEMPTTEYQLSESSTSSDEDIISPRCRTYWTTRETGLVEDAFAEETGYPGKTKILQMILQDFSHMSQDLTKLLVRWYQNSCKILQVLQALKTILTRSYDILQDVPQISSRYFSQCSFAKSHYQNRKGRKTLEHFSF